MTTTDTQIETVAVLGADGYTGWALTCDLLDRGYDVIGVDNFSRRDRADPSVTPIAPPGQRLQTANSRFAGDLSVSHEDLTDFDAMTRVLSQEPDTIINLAQIPSAPYSMQTIHTAWTTKENNIRGTLNLLWGLNTLGLTETPVIQLATMGEYPLGENIPEGFLDDGRAAPKEPGSFYHSSKCQMTLDTRFAAETWGIPITEIYQGIVYGLPDHTDTRLQTRFDVDAVWGTVLNRFTAQAAVGEPLTVYGRGGQKRAMLSIDDCVQCLRLALENPPAPGTPGRYPYRAINQFDGAYRVRELAEMVQDETGAEITRIDNPRVEDDSDHDYDPDREVLDQLGYEPTTSIRDVFRRTHSIIEQHTDRIPVDDLQPDVTWDA